MASSQNHAASRLGLGIRTTDNSPLSQMYSLVPSMIRKAGYSEMWGLSFANTNESTRNTHKTIILQKFLAVNDDDVARAEKQFIKTLKWRRANNPLGKRRKVFDRDTCEGTGYVTPHRTSTGGGRLVVVWNLYGSLKNQKKTLETMQKGNDYMIALMELAIEILNLQSVAAPAPAQGPNPYNIVHVHDCAGTNPWTTCPRIKSGLEQATQIYQDYYPGLLKHHQFVNVGTMHDLGMKFYNLVIPDACYSMVGADIGKFQSCNSRRQVARGFFSSPAEFEKFSHSLPIEYGGSGRSIREAITLKFTESKAKQIADQIQSESDTMSKSILKRGLQSPSEDPEGLNTLDALIVSAAGEGSRQVSATRKVVSLTAAVEKDETKHGEVTKDHSAK